MAADKEILETLAILGAAYPRFTLTQETIKAYSLLLRDLPADELRLAAIWCATNRDFFASVHELRQAAAEMRKQAARIPNAYEAWQDVTRAEPDYSVPVEVEGGGYAVEPRTYRWLHPWVKEVAVMLGWPRTFPGDNTMADRAHFLKAWEQVVEERIKGDIALPEIRSYIEQKRVQLLALAEPAQEAGHADKMP